MSAPKPITFDHEPIFLIEKLRLFRVCCKWGNRIPDNWSISSVPEEAKSSPVLRILTYSPTSSHLTPLGCHLPSPLRRAWHLRLWSVLYCVASTDNRLDQICAYGVLFLLVIWNTGRKENNRQEREWKNSRHGMATTCCKNTKPRCYGRGRDRYERVKTKDAWRTSWSLTQSSVHSCSWVPWYTLGLSNKPSFVVLIFMIFFLNYMPMWGMCTRMQMPAEARIGHQTNQL